MFQSSSPSPRRDRLAPFIRMVATVAMATVVAAGLALAPANATASPQTLTVEGALLTTSQGPVADGLYNLTFAIYANANAKTPLWQEGPVSVPLFGGRFTTVLGGKKPLNISALVAASAPELAIRVGKDPELPRRKLHATPFALHAETAGLAAKAGDVACTGCVSVQEMKFDGDVNLAGYSLKAKNATFTGNLLTKTVSATTVLATTVLATTVSASQFIGDGAKLTNLAVPKGSCPVGQVVHGIAGDGALLCTKALTGNDLPADGLASVSNGLLTNQFTESLAATALPASIPDNTGSAASAKVIVPNLGVAQSLTVQVKVSNTDLSNLRLIVLPPNDKKVGVTLCDPCGAKDAKLLQTSFPDKSKPKTGDLGAWVGKNPQGEWLLRALDSKFCVVQAAGNSALCNLAKKTDGAILTFDVTVKVLSTQKAGVTGLLQLALMSKPPVTCSASLRGSIFYDTSANGIRYCDGTDWRLLADSCGDGVVDLAETCDDGNNIGGDGCSATCTAGSGANALDPGRSCLTILTAYATSKSGAYWLDLDGAGPGKPASYLCDMKKDGGGWTRVYAELPLSTAAWSLTASVTGKINNVNAPMHGPFAQGQTLAKTISLGGLPHKAVRVGGRYFAIDSWDGEHARVSLGGTVVFDRAKVWNQAGGSGWTKAVITPSPWTGPPLQNGFWQLWDVAKARSHTAASVALSLTSGLDQAANDESWLADTLAVWAR